MRKLITYLLKLIVACMLVHTHVLYSMKQQAATAPYGGPYLSMSNNMVQNNTNKQDNYNALSFDPKALMSSASSYFGSITKKQIFCTILLSSYATIQITLWYLRAKLRNQQSWSNWKKELSLSDLYAVKRTELAELLKHDFERKYASDFTVGRSTNMLFEHELEQEIEHIQQYVGLVAFLKKWYLGKLFFYDQALYDQAEMRIMRLEYLKSLEQTK